MSIIFMALFFLLTGEFGDVYKGELTTSDGSKIPIAAKTLKVCRISQEMTNDTVLSLSTPSYLNHHVKLFHLHRHIVLSPFIYLTM